MRLQSTYTVRIDVLTALNILPLTAILLQSQPLPPNPTVSILRNVQELKWMVIGLYYEMVPMQIQIELPDSP